MSSSSGPALWQCIQWDVNNFESARVFSASVVKHIASYGSEELVKSLDQCEKATADKDKRDAVISLAEVVKSSSESELTAKIIEWGEQYKSVSE